MEQRFQRNIYQKSNSDEVVVNPGGGETFWQSLRSRLLLKKRPPLHFRWSVIQHLILVESAARLEANITNGLGAHNNMTVAATVAQMGKKVKKLDPSPKLQKDESQSPSSF